MNTINSSPPQKSALSSDSNNGTSDEVKTPTAAGSLSAYPKNSQPTNDDLRASPVPLLPSIKNFSQEENSSPEEFAIKLGALLNAQSDGQLNSAKTQVKAAHKKLQDITKKAMAKISEWARNCAKAEKKGKWMGILGVCIKALAVVAAVAAVVMTGGLAAPLMFVAVVGMVGAGISLASDISKLSGGKGFQLSTLVFDALRNLGLSDADRKLTAGAIGLIGFPLMIADPAFCGMLVSGMAEKVGANKSQSAIVMTTFTVVAGLAMAAGVARAASSGAAKVAAEATSETAKAVAKTTLSPEVIARFVQICASLLSGVVGVPNAVVTVLKAVDTKNADTALSDKTDLDIFSKRLKKTIMDGHEDMKTFYSDLMAQFDAVSSIINDNSKSISQLTKNTAPGTV